MRRQTYSLNQFAAYFSYTHKSKDINMHSWKILFLALILTASSMSADEYYAIVESKTGKIFQQDGTASTSERHPPCSTFKIPLALIGYETGVLEDETKPLIPYDKKYPAPIESWKNDQTPESWIKNSCVWYSSVIVKQMNIPDIEKYLVAFGYGNHDMSGGNPQAWLGASLKISVEEQISFMRKLANRTLPVSASSIDKTKKILYIDSLVNGWSFYGKTGTARNKSISIGWFAGWVEKGDVSYVIVMLLSDYPRDKAPLPGGPAAKERCRELLWESGLLK